MPYITHELRAKIDPPLKDASEEIHTVGDLTYAMTQLITRYISAHTLSYSSIASVVGALESTKLEFHRRIVAPYEDNKKDISGDVSGYMACERESRSWQKIR